MGSLAQKMPSSSKKRPNGLKSPHLVTLVHCNLKPSEGAKDGKSLGSNSKTRKSQPKYCTGSAEEKPLISKHEQNWICGPNERNGTKRNGILSGTGLGFWVERDRDFWAEPWVPWDPTSGTEPDFSKNFANLVKYQVFAKKMLHFCKSFAGY